MDLEDLGFNEYFVRNFKPVHMHVESPFTNRVVSPLAASCELLPEEYYVSRHMRADAEKLPTIDPELRYTPTDKLFLFFYLAIGEILQLKAANQLFQRGWRYIKTDGIWIARIKDRQLDFRTTTFESGTYQFFNIQSWQREHGQFTLAYEDLAEHHDIGVIGSNANINQTQKKEQAMGYSAAQCRLSSGKTVVPANCMQNSRDVSTIALGSATYPNQYNVAFHPSNPQPFTPVVAASNRRRILRSQQDEVEKTQQMQLQEVMLQMMTNQYRNVSTMKATLPYME